MNIVERKILAKVRGLNTDIQYGYGDEETQFELSGQGEQQYAQAAAPFQEIYRQSRSYYINTVTQVASVIAMPTTACAFAIYNNEPDNGRSYIIDQVWALYTANASIIPQAGLVGVLGQVREAVPTNAMSTTIILKNPNGVGKLDSRSRCILTATALPATTGFAGNWFPICNHTNSAVTSLPGMQSVYNLNGRYIVTPGRYFGIHCVSAKIDVQAQIGISWTEKFLLNG
jgi:hypothetical protein